VKIRPWCAALLVVASTAVRAQEHSLPKPGPEHARLKKQFEGEWDVQTKFMMNPSQPPVESKGQESVKLDLGGFWLLGAFKGEMFGQPFEGRSTTGYSPMKKKYVMSWVDSFMPHLFTGEGDYDEASKTYTFLADGFDPSTGKPAQEKWVIEVKDENSHIMKFFSKGTDGPERMTGEIRYTRRK